MYRFRFLFTLLLCLKAASPAPQAKESDVTYVKIQPMVEDTPADTSNPRESRIEKLPLTFPGISPNDSKEPDKTVPEKTKINEKQAVDLPEKTENIDSVLTEDNPNLSENKSQNPAASSENKSNLPENLEQSETNQSDMILDPNGTEEANITEDLSEISPTDDLLESNSDIESDTVSSETSQSDRRGRNFETTEAAEDVTEKEKKRNDDLIDHTVVDAPRTRAPPKFVPKVSKSSYFPKPKVFQSYSANHLDIVGKRKFRSRCSCQKIWNCPKLQISVPRCPDEYFLCCF